MSFEHLKYVKESVAEVDWEAVISGTSIGVDIEKRESDNGTVDIELRGRSKLPHGRLDENPFQLWSLDQAIRENIISDVDLSVLPLGISSISATEENSLVRFTARVDHVTDTDAVVSETTHECTNCGSETVKEQNILTNGVKEPEICATCEKSSFDELEDERERVDRKTAIASEIVDGQDDPESIILRVFGYSERGTIRPGERFEVTGVVKHIDNDKTGESHREIVVVDIEEDGSDDISVTDEEREKFEELVDSDEYEQKLIDSFAPHVVFRDEEKQGLIYASVTGSGGVPNQLRDTSHVLFIGDPSTGKSELMKEMKDLLPKSTMATGSSSTGVGLTATVEKNDETDEIIASAGALAQAHNGVCFVDELDEFGEEELGKLLSALSDSEIQLNKYTINTTLPANTVFVGSANPKYGEFSGHMDIKDEFEFPPELLARMDQIHVVEKDPENAVAKAKAQAGIGTAQNPPLSKDELKKLFYLARSQKVSYGQDMLTYGAEMAGKLIQNSDAGDMRSGGAVHRLAVASAKLHLRDEVTEEDVDKAVELVAKSLERIGDGSVTYTGLTEDRIDAEQAVEEIIEDIYAHTDENPTRQAIIDRLRDSKDMDPDKVNDAIESKLSEPEYFEVDGIIRSQPAD